MLIRDKSTIKIISMLIFMTLLLLFCLQSATAADITNSTAGGISKGISDTPNGGTLGLADGIYKSVNNTTIDKNLTIKGTSKNNTIINSDSLAFNVEKGNTLTLYNLTIISDYLYTDDDIANYNSLIHNSNGSINGLGNVVFENCLFINNKQTDATVVVTASPTYNTRLASFTATVTDSNGNLLNGDVVFYVNNKFSGRVSTANGIAMHNVNLANGNYVVHAVYIGNFYGGPWNLIGQKSLIGVNPKISRNQISFKVNSTEIQLLSVPLPTSGTIYYVDPVNGQDLATRNGLSIANAWKTISYAYNTGASDNSYIILQPGTYSGTGNVGITLDGKYNMTIIGNDTGGDVTITPGTSRFATINAGTVTNWRTINIYNMKINAGGSTAGGTGSGIGAIQIYGYTVVNIDSIEFNNITGGRAIAIRAGNVNFTINNSQFLNINLSGDAAAIQATGGSTSLPYTNPINIYNCIFENLEGRSNGGVIRNYGGAYGTITIVNSSFNNCYASSHGGIFCTAGDLIVNNTNFTDCRTGAQGGVLYSHGTGNHNFTNTIFINCLAATYGGVLVSSSSGPINVDNCTFINNRATGTSTNGYGGAISASSGAVTIRNSNFINNSATNQGGAVYSSSATINIYNSDFESNSAGSYGGAVASGGTINIEFSDFTNNNAANYGGAIGATSGTITVNNSNFKDNYVFGSATVYGGALGSTTGTINVYYSEFFNNSARNNSATSTAYGGVAGISGSGNINLNNCIVHGNWAKYGGAFGASAGNIRVNNSKVFDNYALDYGGAVGASGSGNIYVTNSFMNNNNATNYGGAVGSSGTGTINVTNSDMTDNRAEGYGGAVGLSANGVINVINSNMVDNIAITFGGAVGATGGTITVRNSSLKKNKAIGSSGYGGAIGLTTGTINVYDSEFTNNTAIDYGGAVGVPSTGTFYANNSAFTHNEAINGYGGALGSGAGVNIAYCNFTDNIAGTNGGAVAAMSTSTVNSILSCQFEYNSAMAKTVGTGLGNAIYAANRLTANYNRFFNNSGSTPGVFTNTLWTNSSQSATNYNLDYNWWGDNTEYAVGHEPKNYVVVDVDTVNYGLWNGSAHYVYTIRLNDTANTNFDVYRLPMFFGHAVINYPPYNNTFDAHSNGTVITVPFTLNARQDGYFRVDNWIKTFNVTTNSTPTVNNLIADLSNTTGRYRDNVTLNATFKDDGGFGIAGLNVAFYVEGVYVGNGTTDSNGFVSHPYTVASAGNLNYTVVYNGHNPNYNSVNVSTTLTFLKLNTYIVVNGYVRGQSGELVGLNVTIYDENNDPVGNVVIGFYGVADGFYANTAANNLGQAGINHTYFTSGNYTWYAYFNGNGNFSATNSSYNMNTGIGIAEIDPVVNLTIVKYSNATGNVSFGDYVTYYINVTNNGPDTATGVQVTDLLDHRLEYLGHSMGMVYNYATGLWDIGTIGVNQTVTLEIYVRINGTGNIVNVANVTNVTEPNTGNNSTNGTNNGTNFTVPGTVNLTINKYSNVTSGNASYKDLVTYTITVINNGPDNATNVQVTDLLDYRLVFINYIASLGTYDPATGQWNIGNLAFGQIETLEIYVWINGTGDIVNVANVTVDQVNIGNNSTEGTNNGTNFTVPNTVNLTITKSSNANTTVGYGDEIEYYITVTNNGPDNATGVIITDILDPRLEYISNNGGAGYSNHTVLWTISNISVGNSVTLTIRVKINGTGNIVNIANVTNVTEVNIGNNSTEGTNNGTNFTVPKTVNLTITKTSDASTNVTVGDIITYTITVTNNGPDNATGVIVNDKLNDRLVWISDTSGGFYDPVTGVWNVSTLNVKETKVLNITVMVNGTGNIVNLANVTVNEVNIGNNSTNGTGNGTNFTIDNTANITITKVSNVTGIVNVDDEVLYTITVSNYGPDNATGVYVIDILDSHLVFLRFNSTTGYYDNNTGRWEIGILRAGETVVLNITVRIKDVGNIPNLAIVGLNEINIGNNTTDTVYVSSDLLLTNVTVNNASSRATESVVITGTLYDENGAPITGTVNITVTGPGGPYNFNDVSVVNGHFNLTVVMNVSGSYSVAVRYGGSTKYGASNNSGSLIIDLMPTNTVVNNATGVATNPVIVNGTVFDDNGVPITGLVNITIDGVLYPNVSVVNGHYSLNITMNISGIYNVTVVYEGNGTYTGSSTLGSLNIHLMPTETNVTNVTGTASEPVVITGTLYDENGVPLTALVNITIDGPGGPYTFNDVSVVNGHFNLTVVLNTTGNYTVTAVYGGNRTYAGSDSRGFSGGSLVIRAMASVTVVNNATGKATETVVINGTVFGANGDPINGTVNITVNGVLYPNVSVVNGHYSLNISMNTSGVYNVVVVYSGDDTYGGSSSTGLLTITVMDSITTITSGSTKPGVSILLTGTLKDVNGVNITGLVDIYIDGTFYQTVNAVNGVFDVNITFNTVGNFSVRAVYNGNNIYGNSSAIGSVFVDEITTTVYVNDSYGRTTEEVIIFGNVTNSLGFPVNGFVNVIINGTTYTVPVVNGQFSLAVIYNITYNYNVQVQYLGDAIFLPSNGSAVMYIAIMPTTTTVVDAPLRVNFTCNLTADLKDDNGKAIAGATVDFYVNGMYVGSNTTDSNGRAVYAYRPNAPGLYSVSAVYNGNQTYTNSNGNLNITAIKMGTEIIIDNVVTKPFINTTVGVTVFDEFGNPVVHANVTVIIGGQEYNLTTDSNGRVYVSYTADEAGDVPISASFNETDLYRGNSSSGVLHVDKIITYILVDNLSITTLDRADFNFTLVDEYGNVLANRLVEVFLDGVSLGTFRTNANGMVFIKHNSLPKGVYSISVTYAGDRVYANAVSNSFIDVRLVKTNLTIYRVTSHSDSSTILVIRLTDEFDRPVPYREVSLIINGVFYGSIRTDANGRAMLTTLYNASGIFEVMGEFFEDDVYEGSMNFLNFNINSTSNTSSNNGSNNGSNTSSNTTGSTNLVVNDVNAEVGEEVELSARLTDENGNPLVNYPVDFYVDGVFIGTAITDSDGIARINYTVDTTGNFVIEAIFNSSGNYSSANGTGLLNAILDSESEDDGPTIVEGAEREYDDDSEGTNSANAGSGSSTEMLNTGNPIAILVLCLLSIFIIGFKRKKRN